MYRLEVREETLKFIQGKPKHKKKQTKISADIIILLVIFLLYLRNHFKNISSALVQKVNCKMSKNGPNAFYLSLVSASYTSTQPSELTTHGEFFTPLQNVKT